VHGRDSCSSDRKTPSGRESEKHFKFNATLQFEDITMYAKTLFSAIFAAAISAVAITPAHAQEVDYLPAQVIQSTLTRAEVRAVLLSGPTLQEQFNADWARPTPFARANGMPLTRVQVMAETREALRLGVLGAREHSTFTTPEQLESIRRAGQRLVQMQLAAL
jgi:hypothetical protein